ncbi:CS1 type fimbrial major subunit [Pantoea dispersa]|uniref:CS1 type fimbrial major subunit n=1 Tax=Pantoea dispersa TaxID=59814 RepID=UPI00133128B0|nr:CS1 type fimbrial major subunit [Pantoea dispersa]KAF0855647.1 CS1 type fimbrial major subunit [Pantoea dispersa 625]
MKAKIITIAAVMATASFAANATNDVQFTVEAQIPDNDFFVVGTGWENTPVKMTWNESALRLNEVSNNIRAKNATGGIKAYLAAKPELLTSGVLTPINLNISVHGKDLAVSPANAVNILTDTEAATERTLVMKVSSPTFTAATRPEAGDYSGSVTMIFDTIPPVTNN